VRIILHGSIVLPTITGAPVTFAMKEDVPAPVLPMTRIEILLVASFSLLFKDF
jgi:hypothetical protein